MVAAPERAEVAEKSKAAPASPPVEPAASQRVEAPRAPQVPSGKGNRKLLSLKIVSADLEEDYMNGIEKVFDKADPLIEVEYQG